VPVLLVLLLIYTHPQKLPLQITHAAMVVISLRKEKLCALQWSTCRTASRKKSASVCVVQATVACGMQSSMSTSSKVQAPHCCMQSVLVALCDCAAKHALHTAVYAKHGCVCTALVLCVLQVPFYYNQLTAEVRWRRPQDFLELMPRPVCSNCEAFEGKRYICTYIHTLLITE
jgi:hypothetical protein